jgi:hypothetical protein
MKQAALCAVWHELSLLPSALQQLAVPCYKIVPLHLLLHLHLQPQQAADEVGNLIQALLSQTNKAVTNTLLAPVQPAFQACAHQASASTCMLPLWQYLWRIS